MIEIDGKFYRNLQEQVLKNQQDILSLGGVPETITQIVFAESDYDSTLGAYKKSIEFMNGIYEIVPITNPTHAQANYRIYSPSLLAIFNTTGLNDFSGAGHTTSNRYIEYSVFAASFKIAVILGMVYNKIITDM